MVCISVFSSSLNASRQTNLHISFNKGLSHSGYNDCSQVWLSLISLILADYQNNYMNLFESIFKGKLQGRN